jgi:enoyl-CoA hydratase/carnithine racemase
VSDEELVLYDVQDGVALVTFNRPEVKNAWSYAMEGQYFELLDRAADSAEVRSIVVTGAGAAFCPGMDVKKLEQGAAGPGPNFEGRRPLTYPSTIPKPIIAAINGACAGIGLVQALHCDLRFVSRKARISTAFARRGLVGEHGVTGILPRLVGVEWAFELLLSGRVLDADEAVAIGLVSRMFEPDDLVPSAVDYARQLATFSSPLSMAVIKRQIYQDLNDDIELSRTRAIELVGRFSNHPDFVEGMSSFVERREPRFQALSPGFDLNSK